MKSAGFTLTEALIALAILGVALASILPTFLTYQDSNTRSEERSGAVAAAQESMESMRQVDPGLLPTSGSSPVEIIKVGEREFEVVARFCTRNEFCGTDSRHVLLEVFHGGHTIYSLETVYTRLR